MGRMYFLLMEVMGERGRKVEPGILMGQFYRIYRRPLKMQKFRIVIYIGLAAWKAMWRMQSI